MYWDIRFLFSNFCETSHLIKFGHNWNLMNRRRPRVVRYNVLSVLIAVFLMSGILLLFSDDLFPDPNRLDDARVRSLSSEDETRYDGITLDDDSAVDLETELEPFISQDTVPGDNIASYLESDNSEFAGENEDKLAYTEGETGRNEKSDENSDGKLELQPDGHDYPDDMVLDSRGQKYLIPIITAETITDALVSLEGAIFLASQSNRTLVLPRVGSGSVGFQFSQHIHPLEMYFDTATIKDFVGTINFNDWVEKYQEWRIVLLSMQTKGHCRNAPHPKLDSLFDRMNLDFSAVICLAANPTSFAEASRPYSDSETLAIILDDINMIQLHSGLYPRVEFDSTITYHVENWIDTHFGFDPFLAIRWSTAGLSESRIQLCTRALADYVQEVLNERGLTRVYLSTDLEGGNQSTSRDFMRNAYDDLLDALDGPDAYERDDSALDTRGDSGMIDIIDMLICTRANFFFGLKASCSIEGGESSFSQQVAAWRERLHLPTELSWPVDLENLSPKDSIKGDDIKQLEIEPEESNL